MALTDAKIKSMKATGKRQKIADGDGLYLEVTEAGSKIFRMRIQVGGKDSSVTLGKYPYMTLAQARLARNDMLRDIANGIDPREERRKEKHEASAPTFRAVAEEWIEKNKAAWHGTTERTTRQRLELDAYPAIGDTPITDITPRMVFDMVRRIEARGSVTTARKVLAHIKQVFRYAFASLYVESDPVAGLSSDMLAKAPVQHRAAVTTREEAAFVVRCVRRYEGSPIVGMAMEMLMLTFVRPSNIRWARWEDIDLDKKVWTIPPEQMKMQREHKVPLSRQAIELLRKAEAWHDPKNPLVFPSKYGKHGAVLSLTTFWTALRVMGLPKETMSAHGFRSMASSLLNEAGYYPDVIERQLAHAGMDSIREIYNRTEYWEDRVTLMQAWADMLDDLEQSYSSGRK